MSHTVVAPANTDFFSVWFLRTVDLCNYMSTEVVTANTSAGGAFTTGNGFVTGIFGGTVLCANVVQGGIVGTPAALNVNSNINFLAGMSINVASNAAINSTSYFVGNSSVNTFINSSSLSISGQVLNSAMIAATASFGSVNVTTTTTATQNVDSFTKASARSAEYSLTMTDTVSNNYQMANMLVLWDGTNVSLVQYGVITSNSTIAAYGATTNATHVVLTVTPTTTGGTIKGFKQVIPL